MTKLTAWFPPNIKPVRAGVYRTHFPGESGIWFQYWTGRHWGCFDRRPDVAAEFCNVKSGYQNVSWCGLTKEAE